MKQITIVVTLLGLLLLTFPGLALSEDTDSENRVYQAGEVQVTAEAKKQPVVIAPDKSVITMDDYESVGTPQNVGDVVKDLVIIDYRGASDLLPDDDTLYMRGFSSKRFVTSLDGMTLRKTGGRRSSHIVDYALLPPFLIESVEVLPGPHSALYPGKSIGGVVNFITSEPKRYDSLKPDITVSVNYGTYDTQNHSASVQGGAGNFTYDLGVQKYATSGYLRHADVDINTVFGRVGYLLPNDGYVTFMASYADADRKRATVNDPYDPESDWDPNYPLLEKAGRIYYQWQNPTWDKESPYFRFNLKQPSSLGTWLAFAYYGEENRNNSLMEYVDADDPSQGTKDGSWDTRWYQQGGKIANEFKPAENHVTTIGAELEQCYDGYDKNSPRYSENNTFIFDRKKKIEIMSGFAQHKWAITPRLDVTAGLRFEDTTIWVTNRNNSTGAIYITGREAFIERNWSAWSPKSFFTYELDGLSDNLRDTSVSLGVSKIWRAPDYHGDYNPQGRPTGVWLDPEHGVAYDLVLNRRLIGDIQMKLNYAYYQIKDYIAYNRDFAKYTPSGGNPVEPGMEYLDYKINLEEVIRHGVEVQLGGHLTDDLSFLVGYAWQDFENQGNEPAGETELDDRAANRVNGKLTYQLYETTSVTLDYEFQDDQVTKSAYEIAPDVYEYEEIPIDAFHVVDLSIKHRMFKNWKGIKDGMVRLYVNNLFSQKYENVSGYPATDLTIGAGLSFQL